ncbi:MAG: hypothetical protein V1905_03550, partial [bacterium]
MESFEPTFKPEEKFAGTDECYKKAVELYEKHKKEIKDNLHKPIDGLEEYRDYPNSIRHFLEQVSGDELKRFYGHGITKKDDIHQLAAAISILENYALRGDTAPVAD